MADAILAGSGIYTIRNTVNNKIYVGSAVKLSRRFSEHKTSLSRKANANAKLQMAWNKYGADAFVFDVVEVVVDKRDLICREQHWIDALRSAAPDLYNISPTAGSSLGVKHSAETRAARSKSLKGRKVSLETRAKIAASTKARMTEEVRARIRAATTGVIFSDERRAKIAAARKVQERRPLSDEVKAKISAAHKGKKYSDERRAQISQSQIGRKLTPEAIAKTAAANRGRPRSEEVKAKISAGRKAAFAQKLKERSEPQLKLPF